MFAALTAAMTALKETAGLVKVISDAKTDAEVKAATFELQSKLLTLQSDCFALGNLISARDEELAYLKAVIAENENFQREAEGFILNKFESGSLVYSKTFPSGGQEITVNACPQCFSQKKISILQPSTTVTAQGGFFVHYCPGCQSQFKLSKLPPKKTMQVQPHRVSPRFGGSGSW